MWLSACDLDGSLGAKPDGFVPGGGDTPSDPSDEGPPDDAPPLGGLLAPPEVIVRADSDDDDGDRTQDWKNGWFADNDELTSLVLTLSPGAGGRSLRLRLDGDVEALRVWHDGGLLLGDGVAEATLDGLVSSVVLQVQAGELQRQGQLTVEEVGVEGAAPVVITLTSAPLLLHHHLQPAEQVWAVKVRSQLFGNNEAFVDAFQQALGAAFTEVPGARYGGDVWFQDELELGSVSSPDGRMDLVIDSVRDRGLDRWAEDAWRGEDHAVRVWGRGAASSQDSFGNLEVSPPVTVGGVSYPFGRIYYGAAGRFGPVQPLRDVLAEQVVQAPFEVDTSWLCVGHVDEFISFIPDSAAPKGFRLVYSDTDAAWDLLETLDPAMELPQYGGRWTGHGYDTVGDIVEDRGLRAFNDDLRDLHLAPILEQLKAELGLDEADVLRLPSLFEAVRTCEGGAAAMIPGMVNLVVANLPGQPTKVLLADPFLRPDLADPATDPLIARVRELFPPEIELVFVDDWDTYHLALGEVHCGSNVRRTPVEAWWDLGAGLLGRAP